MLSSSVNSGICVKLLVLLSGLFALLVFSSSVNSGICGSEVLVILMMGLLSVSVLLMLMMAWSSVSGDGLLQVRTSLGLSVAVWGTVISGDEDISIGASTALAALENSRFVLGRLLGRPN